MASLGTLAAELKLEGAAGMMSGLRAAGGAVSSLGHVLGGIRAPLAQLDGALRAVQKSGAGTSAAVAPVQAAAAAIHEFPGQASRAAAALQILGRARAGMLGRNAPGVNLGAMPRLTQARIKTSGDKLVLPNTTAGLRRQRNDAVERVPQVAMGADFTRGLRGTLEQFKAGLRTNGSATGRERHASSSGRAGARLAALLGQLRVAGGGGRTLTSHAGAGVGTGAGRRGEGDRLARIGGFIGGGGPALDFHRRTAAATEKTAAGIQALLQRLPAAQQPLTALWA